MTEQRKRSTYPPDSEKIRQFMRDLRAVQEDLVRWVSRGMLSDALNKGAKHRQQEFFENLATGLNVLAQERATPDWSEVGWRDLCLGAPAGLPAPTPWEFLSEIERGAYKLLYKYPGGHASAIRLFGSGDEVIPERLVRVHYEHKQFVAPEDLAEVAANRLERRRQEPGQLFNGPCVRLDRWWANPQDGPGVALEVPTMDLYLSPIGWYDYEGLNGPFRDEFRFGASRYEYEKYASYTRLVETGNVSEVQLSNIVGTATTILSRDGLVAYQKRGELTSAAPKKLTCGVAENINRYFDDADPQDSTVLFNKDIGRALRPSHRYRPKGVPHPFAAVRRGIAEELSPNLLAYLGRNSVKLVGLAFDLASLHPDLLFVAVLDLPADDILKLWETRPGKHQYEGEPVFIPPDFLHLETAKVLNGVVDWNPGGKASLVRAIECLDALRLHFGSLPKTVRFLKI